MSFLSRMKLRLVVPVGWLCLAAVSYLMTGCSQQKVLLMQKVQADFKNHNQAYSSYVQDNLKHSADTKRQTKSHNTQSVAKTSQQMKGVQSKLLASKRQAHGLINQARQQNGIFKPSRTLQKTVNALHNQTQQENWLKNNSSLSSILTLVLRNNLTIQARVQEAKTTLSRYDQVRFLDDTMAQYAAFADKPSTASFPFPGVLSLKASIIDSAVESSRLNLIKSIQDVITQARIAYYELQFAQQESRLVKQKGDLLLALKEQLGDAFESQNMDLDLIVKVDVDIEKQRNRQQLAQHRQQARQARLNALLNVSSVFKLGKLDRMTTTNLLGLKKKSTDTERLLLALSKKHRVEVALLQTDLIKVERIIKLSERRFYPDYTASYSRFQNRTIKQVGSNATKAAFSSRPTIRKRNFFGNDNAYLEETRNKYRALQVKLKALHKMTEDNIQQNYSQYSAQESSYSLYGYRVIPKLQTALDIVKNQYETGGSTYLNVINTKNVIIDARLSSLQALKDMNVKAAKLTRLVGLFKGAN